MSGRVHTRGRVCIVGRGRVRARIHANIRMCVSALRYVSVCVFVL